MYDLHNSTNKQILTSNSREMLQDETDSGFVKTAERLLYGECGE